MKKIIAITLLLTLVLTLCACGKEEKTTDSTGGNGIDGVLSIGYSRMDITPTEAVPLAGYGNTSQRVSSGFLDYLMTTCVAYTGPDGTTVLQYQNDLISSSDSWIASLKKEISYATDVPVDNIIIAATHTHSAPDVYNSEFDSIARYLTKLSKTMVECGKAAMADRKPATSMKIGSITLPVNTLNFIRHYNLDDGTVAGDNFGIFTGNTILSHTHDADSVMQVVRLDREDGETVALINWQAHPHRANGNGKEVYYSMTSDIVGALRDKMEKELGCKVAYYTGASGNINSHSKVTAENITDDYKEQGEALADYAIQCYNENLTDAELGDVKILKKTYTGTVNHTEDDKVAAAQIVKQEWETNNNFTKATELARQYGLNSPYHASGIISKAALGATYDVNMWVYTIGDLAFATAPYEMFDENGVTIKEGSPYEATFVITCCNGALGYIPSVEGYTNNCYGANTGKFISGTGEILADEYVALLEELYNAK